MLFFFKISITFGFMYIYFYITNLFFLLNFCIVFTLRSLLAQVSLTAFWQSLNFLSFGWILRVLFLQLAGLPPMFIFFVKFSFILTAFYVSTVFTCFLIFINLLLSMFFYLQMFKTAPQSFANKPLLDLTVKKSSLKQRNKYKFTRKKFLLFYNFFWFFLISLFSFCFYTDFFVLLQIVCN